ncbi:MAG TPA: FtsH protease activity modulator HflK [Methyloversatilis sp.]
MSLNDPRWGNQGGNGNKGGNQGPPDLEDLWRDFNRRLSGMFGGKSGDGGNRPPVSSRQFGGGIGVILGLVLIVWLASGLYIVDASQRGVVLRFGKLHETTEPGLQWRLPYPIDSHELVNLTGVRTVEVGYRGTERNKVLNEALMLTDDENIINIQFAVQYILKDPVAYLFQNRSPEDTVVHAAETAMREIVGKSKMDFVLYEGREQIAADAQHIMQQILDRYQTGIQISRLTLQNAQPPEQVQAAFDDAVKAGQDLERQKNEGQAYANDVIPKARGTASRLLEESNGYKQRIIATAQGDASRFKQVLAEYVKAPEVTRQRLYIDTMQQVLMNTSKVMVDAKGGNNLLYLPLDKLMQQAGAAVAADGAASGARAGEVVTLPPLANDSPAVDMRSRDALRARERGER